LLICFSIACLSGALISKDFAIEMLLFFNFGCSGAMARRHCRSTSL
jgi:hypothetical protein